MALQQHEETELAASSNSQLSLSQPVSTVASTASTRSGTVSNPDESENDNDWTEWRDQPNGDSTFAAWINLVKGAIGSGIVYFPAAAGSCGLLLALILVVVMAIVSAHTTALVAVILLMARNLGVKLVGQKSIDTFEDIARVCWGKCGYIIVTVINYLDLVLTVAVFMGTLANTVDDVIVVVAGENVNPDGSIDYSYSSPYWRFIGLVGLCILVVFPLCILKTLDSISKMSVLGVAANVVILVCIVASACQDNPNFDANVNLMGQYANNATINTNQQYMDMFKFDDTTNTYVPQKKMFDFTHMFVAYGNFGFSFAVAVITPSLVVNMKKPRAMNRVAWLSHVAILLVYCAIIFTSFFAWGDGVAKASIDMDQPAGERLTIDQLSVINSLFMPTLWVQIVAASCLFISIVSSVPLFFFSIAEFAEGLMKEKWPGLRDLPPSKDWTFRIVNRGGLLLVICCFNFMGAANLPDFQGLTGAITTTAMCSILPNVIFLCLKRRFEKGSAMRHSSTWLSFLTWLSIVVGCATAVIGFLFNGLPLFGVDMQKLL